MSQIESALAARAANLPEAMVATVVAHVVAAPSDLQRAIDLGRVCRDIRASAELFRRLLNAGTTKAAFVAMLDGRLRADWRLMRASGSQGVATRTPDGTYTSNPDHDQQLCNLVGGA